MAFGLTKARRFVHFYTLPEFEKTFHPVHMGLVLILIILVNEVLFILFSLHSKGEDLSNFILQLIRGVKTVFSIPFTGILLFTIRESYESHVEVCLLAGATLVLSVGTECLFNYLNFTYFFSNLNINARVFSPIYCVNALINKLILSFVVLRVNLSQPEVVVFEIVYLLFFSVMILTIFLRTISFYDDVTEFTNCLKNVFLFSFFLFSFLREFTLLIEDNYVVVTLVFWFWFSWALHNILGSTKYEILIKNPTELKDQHEAKSYVRLLYQIFLYRLNNTNSMILAGIIKEHFSNCKNPECICRKNYASSSAVIKNEFFMLSLVYVLILEIEERFDNLELRI